jgi:hypothetical protein
MYRHITLLTLSLVLVACGGGDDNSDTPENNSEIETDADTVTNDDSNESEASLVAGFTWKLCNQFSGSSTQFPQVFTDTDYVAIYNTFTNDNCSGEPLTSSEVSAGTYTLGNTVVTSGGFTATEIDFHVTSVVGSSLPTANQYTLYDIVYVENDLLYYGDIRSDSADTRPNTINFEDAYTQEN